MDRDTIEAGGIHELKDALALLDTKPQETKG